MKFSFTKYHGTGNDFILVDNRGNKINKFTSDVINKICQRRFGIGADGFMLLDYHPEYDFRMRYFNSDGYEGTMCGNGGRCVVAFAKKLKLIKQYAIFESIDGIHEAYVDRFNNVKLKMQDVFEVNQGEGFYELNTGSPHFVKFIDDPDKVDMEKEGKSIRFSEKYKGEGINVNIGSIDGNNIKLRTYERGVEAETYSCGTGSVAAALSAALEKSTPNNEYKIYTRGGTLKILFKKANREYFHDIWLEGPAKLVFEGKMEL
jgi:diaminopimelate epimerase